MILLYLYGCYERLCFSKITLTKLFRCLLCALHCRLYCTYINIFIIGSINLVLAAGLKNNLVFSFGQLRIADRPGIEENKCSLKSVVTEMYFTFWCINARYENQPHKLIYQFDWIRNPINLTF